MLKLYQNMAILLFILLFMRFLAGYLVDLAAGAYAFPEALLDLNIEASLAKSQSAAFESYDQYNLELLPGISTTLSKRILAKKSEIEELSQFKTKNSPLELVYGIGPKTAAKLEKYIDLE